MKKFDDNFSYLKVLSGGQTTSLQDFGRYGHQDKGVPPSGVINFQNMILYYLVEKVRVSQKKFIVTLMQD